MAKKERLDYEPVFQWGPGGVDEHLIDSGTAKNNMTENPRDEQPDPLRHLEDSSPDPFRHQGNTGPDPFRHLGKRA